MNENNASRVEKVKRPAALNACPTFTNQTDETTCTAINYTTKGRLSIKCKANEDRVGILCHPKCQGDWTRLNHRSNVCRPQQTSFKRTATCNSNEQLIDSNCYQNCPKDMVDKGTWCEKKPEMGMVVKEKEMAHLVNN